MFLLYSVHVVSCHCCMFTEHYHFNIFGNEWDRKIIITVISDHLSHAQGRWLVYFSFTELKRRPKSHVAAATAHYYNSRAAVWCLKSVWSYYHLLTQAIMPILNWLEEQIKLLICLNRSIQRDHPKYSTLHQSLIVWWVLAFHASIYPSQTTLPLELFKDFSYGSEIEWDDAQYHEADRCLKWLCYANFCAIHRTLKFSMIVLYQVWGMMTHIRKREEITS